MRKFGSTSRVAVRGPTCWCKLASVPYSVPEEKRYEATSRVRIFNPCPAPLGETIQLSQCCCTSLPGGFLNP